MKISPQMIIGILQFIWPLVSDDIKEQAAKTKTKWDDRALMLIDLLLGNLDPSVVADKEALVEYLLQILSEVAPEMTVSMFPKSEA
jgi:hypothetical protein